MNKAKKINKILTDKSVFKKEKNKLIGTSIS